MRRIGSILFTVAIAFVSLSSSAKADFKGWVDLERNRSLYIDFASPKAGHPIVVLANGLTHDIRYWQPFAEGLRSQGFGVLRWDMMGQLKSLERYGKPQKEIPYIDQIKDLRKLLVKLNLRAPMHFVGLSYGGMVVSLYTALFPEHVITCVAMAPFVAPIAAQDDWIRLQIQATRIAFPMNPATDDELYLYFLRQIVYSTYPIAEPSVFDHPYKLDATMFMALGARKYRFADIVDRIAPGKFHLVIAERDEYLSKDVTDAAWDALPRKVRMSRTIIQDTKHKIIEIVPYFSSALVGEILRGNNVFTNGRTLFADPAKGIVHDGHKALITDLPRD